MSIHNWWIRVGSTKKSLLYTIVKWAHLHATVVNDHRVELYIWVELRNLLTLSQKQTIRQLPATKHKSTFNSQFVWPIARSSLIPSIRFHANFHTTPLFHITPPLFHTTPLFHITPPLSHNPPSSTQPPLFHISPPWQALGFCIA